MNKFIVSTDAAADLDLDYIKENEVKTISMKYFLQVKEGEPEKEFVFGNGEDGLSIVEFYAKMREGVRAKTSLIDIETHKAHFSELLKEGKDIVHIPLSSGLSGTAGFAQMAAEELAANYPDQRIFVVDFKGASMGQGLAVDYLVRMRNEGKAAEEAADWMRTNALKFCHFFTVDDLDHLRRGGRVSGVAAFIGTLIKIKPLLHIDDAGKLIAIGKNIGRKKALNNLVEKMKALSSGEKQRVFISHGDCREEAEIVADRITEIFGITDIKIGFIGPIVGAHSGPGTVALFFMGEHR